ncbi:MAG: hypothetical protein WCI20_15200, partial [bacterium]
MKLMGFSAPVLPTSPIVLISKAGIVNLPSLAEQDTTKWMIRYGESWENRMPLPKNYLVELVDRLNDTPMQRKLRR